MDEPTLTTVTDAMTYVDNATFATHVARQRKLERRLHVTWAVAAVGAMSALVISPQSASIAQTIGVTLTSLNTRLMVVEAKTASMSVSTVSEPNGSGTAVSVPTVTFTGVNLQIVNGAGNTEIVNGAGNVIIGYNETRGTTAGDIRTGSHNLIIGVENNYTSSSFGGVVFGAVNTISSNFACVTGGNTNTANGVFATITGGYANTASGNSDSITGGDNNTASGEFSSITGGGYNVASYTEASVTGGAGNLANGLRASVTGGANNQASQQEASVTGGLFNTANAPRASVTGGGNNNASAYLSTVSGGTFIGQGNTNGWSGGGYHTP